MKNNKLFIPVILLAFGITALDTDHLTFADNWKSILFIAAGLVFYILLKNSGKDKEE